eukprot:1157773-Pelagomonas_calceolata.AAC.3
MKATWMDDNDNDGTTTITTTATTATITLTINITNKEVRKRQYLMPVGSRGCVYTKTADTKADKTDLTQT